MLWAAVACAAPPADSPRDRSGRWVDEAAQRGATSSTATQPAPTARTRPTSSPADAIRAALAKRAALLATARDAAQPAAERAEATQAATAVLRGLIDEHPDHPDRFAWRCDVAEDLLDRREGEAVEAMLYRGPSAAQRSRVAAAAGEAIPLLERLGSDIEAEWKRIGALPPDAYAELAASDRLRRLESVEASAAWLLAWARVYAAMAGPADAPSRDKLLTLAADEVTTRRGWTARPHAETGLQVQALVLAGLANRLRGRYDLADAALRHAIDVYARLPDAKARSALDRWALLAVIEQVRLLRDRGATDAARSAIERAYAWARQARPDEAAAIISIALLEREIAPPAPAADALRTLARDHRAARTQVYAALGERLRDQPDPSTADELDRLGLVSMLATEGVRLDEAAQLAIGLGRSGDPFIQAEALFFLARCREQQGRPTAAAATLLQLVREHASSDRAAEAVEATARLAARGVRQPDAAGRGAAGDTLIDAVRMLRQRRPDDADLPALTVAAGEVLRERGQWADAANEFEQVPAKHALAGRAALERARCLARVFEASHAAAEADAAIAAADVARRRLESAAPSAKEPCAAADAILLRAAIQADPSVRQYEAALRTLQDFEKRYDDCTAQMAVMWRVRITAMESLGRLKDANALVARAMEADPRRAGPVMQGLLARLREKADRLRDAGDAAGVRELGVEAAALAERLERWSAEHAPADVAAVRLARAEALLAADRPADAATLADAAPERTPDWQFIRAECLYKAGRYSDALPMFLGVWNSAPERSSLWWRALLRNLQCHTEIGTDPKEILASIRQHEQIDAGFGGPATRREFERLEARNRQRAGGG